MGETNLKKLEIDCYYYCKVYAEAELPREFLFKVIKEISDDRERIIAYQTKIYWANNFTETSDTFYCGTNCKLFDSHFKKVTKKEVMAYLF